MLADNNEWVSSGDQNIAFTVLSDSFLTNRGNYKMGKTISQQKNRRKYQSLPEQGQKPDPCIPRIDVLDALVHNLDTASPVMMPEKQLSRTPPANKFDRPAVLKKLLGDEQLLRELAVIFLSETPKSLAKIEASIAESNAQALHYHAHNLKNGLGNFGFQLAVRLAFELEKMGFAGELNGAWEIFNKLAGEIENILDEIRLVAEAE